VPSLVLRTAAARFDPANVAQVDLEPAVPKPGSDT
jgi:hypothetical protein